MLKDLLQKNLLKSDAPPPSESSPESSGSGELSWIGAEEAPNQGDNNWSNLAPAPGWMRNPAIHGDLNSALWQAYEKKGQRAMLWGPNQDYVKIVGNDSSVANPDPLPESVTKLAPDGKAINEGWSGVAKDYYNRRRQGDLPTKGRRESPPPPAAASAPEPSTAAEAAFDSAMDKAEAAAERGGAAGQAAAEKDVASAVSDMRPEGSLPKEIASSISAALGEEGPDAQETDSAMAEAFGRQPAQAGVVQQNTLGDDFATNQSLGIALGGSAGQKAAPLVDTDQMKARMERKEQMDQGQQDMFGLGNGDPDSPASMEQAAPARSPEPSGTEFEAYDHAPGQDGSGNFDLASTEGNPPGADAMMEGPQADSPQDAPPASGGRKPWELPDNVSEADRKLVEESLLPHWRMFPKSQRLKPLLIGDAYASGRGEFPWRYRVGFRRLV